MKYVCLAWGCGRQDLESEDRTVYVMELFDVRGKRAILTGGAGDLASSMAEGLTSAGVTVALIDFSAQLARVAESVGALAVYGDLSTPEGCRGAFDEALSLLGGVDILINAVGIGCKRRPEDFSWTEWRRVIDVDLNSMFYFSQLAGRVMLEQGGGHIVNIGSMGSFASIPENAAYCSAKGAVALLTRTLARDWAASGIHVNGIAPGYMDTRLNKRKDDPVEGPAILRQIAAGRLGTGGDLVGPLLFLCSRASDYISGVMLPVDGGYLA
ncbi:SDR family oxidoreductase [Pseudoflavonifractor sp. BIOML-A6]|jgi:dehydrogenases with different specificities (related to short-chain alcohol dehydrogenases)|nr:SDR family oxidoreductase [Bacteroides thetaiotaomicron]MTQ96864.1 SDR family oxidoreductase [Pseudoflavonifractor sp. BIOML-A16]MTR05043.1 SDR family oxidoreductase [Pseudoflavonifractor sp. BIOML-A15]MTR12557.1 SDR family oxidoreductase [Pseudoflavonifractor sp. BIOML-A17]MTR20440.1 SDR family oxidoreductase [Pseudoflavonifractor sp. BIOML-A19]MTR32664.1 SDR family oxidoreductase [Pseudoflavonifractor sp. BIOML-A14]MTR37057.1 SDR family oxidoreductase [Pseudoflavonifractor sp. BIOML-A9]